VSGPEILDKFVGSSEKNLREIFDNPPDLYFNYKKNFGDALAQTALHVIVLDEFDAIARTRGGAGGKGDQGDAGVARDSVVNQLLAKMDGVSELGVPTLLIGLTNKPSLIDPALMRPGRFEVQINVPKPKTVAQRVAILKVHMDNMIKSGRVLVRDCPEGTPAWRRLQAEGSEGIPSFDELLDLIAVETDGMSGASLAGVSRAAASRALERAVTDFAGRVAQDSIIGLSDRNDIDGGDDDNDQNSIANCLVTLEDFEKAVEDVFESAKGSDYIEPPSKSKAQKENEDVNKIEFNTGEFVSLKNLLHEMKITKDSWRR
jgi:SpoVK/Ycf46/Vps4 family AAA+-type ATPase